MGTINIKKGWGEGKVTKNTTAVNEQNVGLKVNVFQHSGAPCQRGLCFFGVGWCERPRSLHSTPTVVATVGRCYCCFWCYCCYYYMLTPSSLLLPPVCQQKPKGGRVLLLSSSSLLVFRRCPPLAEPTGSRLTESLGNEAFVSSAPLLHISTHNMLGMRP